MTEGTGLAEVNILGAALPLFARQGFEGTSMRDIASDAGVRASTLYHYIGTKEDLLLTIMKRGMGSVIESARRTLRGLESPEERLAALARMHVALQGSYGWSVLVIDAEYRSLSGENRAKVKGLRDEYESLWRRALEDGVSGGVFGVQDPKLAAFALLEMCNGVARWYRPDGALPLETVAEDFADMALGLARAQRGGRPVRAADLALPEPVVDASGFFESDKQERWEEAKT